MKFNKSAEEIETAIEQIDLIDNLIPEALPLYINHEWVSKEVREHYKEKLANAGELQEIIKRVTENPDKGPIFEIEI